MADNYAKTPGTDADDYSSTPGSKCIKTVRLSGLDGMKNVQFGDAPPMRRRTRDYSKEGVPADTTHYDDQAVGAGMPWPF